MSSPAALDPGQQPLLPGVVPRATLARRLDAVGPGGLALLVASAGSGKSVLVNQWASARPRGRIGGLALSRRHEDAVVLARDLVDAIRTAAPEVDPGIRDLVIRGGSALGDPLVDGLLDALSGLSEDLVLVLEDLHVLDNRALIDDLGRLLTNLPTSTRAVVTSRRDPPWPLSRLRLHALVVEVRGADLAFRADEAHRLLENVAGRDLTDGQVTALLDRTDGWAAGLQLAGISLRHHPDPPAFIASFAGNDRFVAEYLLQEVIDHLDADVRRFLLRTSMLEWLSAEVCDAVTGTGDGRDMLRTLGEQSLFLIPLDRSGDLFRYHHLFADLLVYELRVEDPGAAAQLHRRAARWLLDHARPEEAVRHLLAAGEHTEAFRVISEVGHVLYERGESATLVGWLGTIRAEQPDVPAAVEVSLLAAQLAVDEPGDVAETHRRLMRRPDLTLGERTAANALYTMLAFRDQQPDNVLRVAAEVRDAIPRLGPDDVVDFLGIGGIDSAQVMAEYGAAGALFLAGDLSSATSALEHVLTLPGTDYPVWKVYVLGTSALVRAWSGHSSEALRLARTAMETARAFGIPHHPATTHAHLAAALAHLDRAEPEPAAMHLAESGRQVRVRVASVTYFDLQRSLETRLTALTDGPAHALAVPGMASSSSSEAPVVRWAEVDFHTHLLIISGALVAARTVLDGTGNIPELTPCRIDIALATGELSTARRLLDGWQPAADDRRSVVRRLLRAYLVLEAEGEHRAAASALAEAAARAEDDRLRWPFLEVPTALRALRRQARHPSALTHDGLWELAVRMHPVLGAQAGLVEPLTERELEVLALLPGRAKNHEIAAGLYVSLNTLKTHLSNIYRKLGVTERNQAVARATELGLI